MCRGVRRVRARLRSRQDGIVLVRKNRGGEQRKHRSTEQDLREQFGQSAKTVRHYMAHKWQLLNVLVREACR